MSMALPGLSNRGAPLHRLARALEETPLPSRTRIADMVRGDEAGKRRSDTLFQLLYLAFLRRRDAKGSHGSIGDIDCGLRLIADQAEPEVAPRGWQVARRRAAPFLPAPCFHFGRSSAGICNAARLAAALGAGGSALCTHRDAGACR